MTRLLLQSSRLALRPPLRALTTTRPRSLPAQPRENHPDAGADNAHLPMDKKSKPPQTEHGGSAQGAPTGGGTGGPTEKTGLADPGIPKGEAENAKQGMTGGGDKPVTK